MGDEMQLVQQAVRRSESIAAIADAMSKAQAQIEGAKKDKTNPHFKNDYADLASVWDACREALSANGVAVIQPPSAVGPKVTVTTMLIHKSGEWIEADLEMTAQQNTPQGIGSCITYARRYGLAAMVGVAPEDDDGNAASQGAKVTAKPVAAPPMGFAEWLTDIEAVAEQGTTALQAAWKASKAEYRDHIDPKAWMAIKAKAAKVAA
jgi:hypothetical protein